MNLQELFRRSFAIWWRVRSLWVAGAIAALFGYSEYGANLNVQWRSSSPMPIQPGDTSPFDQFLADPQLAWLINNLTTIIVFIVVISLAWAIVGGLVSAMANGAMIRIADGVERDQPTDLGSGLSVGVAHMLPIFLIGIILALPILLIVGAGFVILGGAILQAFSGRMDDPASALPALFGAIACFIPLALLGAVLGIVLGLIGRLSIRACVIEGLGTLASIGRGWGLFRRNLGSTLLLWLLMAILGMVLSALLGVPSLALLLPITSGMASQGFAGIPALAVIGLVIYGLVVNVGIGGALTGLSATIWTLFYRSLLEREGAVL